MKEKDLYIILKILQVNTQNRNKLHLNDLQLITGMPEEIYLRKISLLEGMGYIQMTTRQLLNITQEGSDFLDKRRLMKPPSAKENHLLSIIREDTYSIIGVLVALLTLCTILVYAF